MYSMFYVFSVLTVILGALFGLCLLNFDVCPPWFGIWTGISGLVCFIITMRFVAKIQALSDPDEPTYCDGCKKFSRGTICPNCP